jgi:hypothetical protein
MALMMEAVSTSETSVSFYQTTWHNIFVLASVRTCNLTKFSYWYDYFRLLHLSIFAVFKVRSA